MALSGRDIDTLGLSPFLKVLSSIDGGAKDGSREEKCRGETFETEQHRYWPPQPSTSSSFIPEQSTESEGSAQQERLPVVHLVDVSEFARWEDQESATIEAS
jgi:hypothetical protein